MHFQTVLSSSSASNSISEIPKCYPFLKWAGGKTQLLRPLVESLPNSHFNKYFEPFLGGGALFFYLISNQFRFKAHLSDLNSELIETYNVVKNQPRQLIRILERYQKKYNNNPTTFYYELRKNNKLSSETMKAARFITLNKTCYNGLYRVNSKGLFNVPIGNYIKPVICDVENLMNINKAFAASDATIRVNDYSKIINKVEQDDFVYLDPPYNPISNTANFTNYTKNGFGIEDQKNLAKFFRILDKKGCKVLLSNSDTPFIRDLYSNFKAYFREIIVLRSINCDGSKRKGHKELLIRNYK